MLAFGRVSDNRVAKKSAKAAKIEKERLRQEKREEARLQSLTNNVNGHTTEPLKALNGDVAKVNGKPNGAAKGTHKTSESINYFDDAKLETESESGSSLTETSEEEMIV